MLSSITKRNTFLILSTLICFFLSANFGWATVRPVDLPVRPPRLPDVPCACADVTAALLAQLGDRFMIDGQMLDPTGVNDIRAVICTMDYGDGRLIVINFYFPNGERVLTTLDPVLIDGVVTEYFEVDYDSLDGILIVRFSDRDRSVLEAVPIPLRNITWTYPTTDPHHCVSDRIATMVLA